MRMRLDMIRGSESQDFLRCRKKWNYRWVQNLEAKKPNDKFFVGNLVHKFLEEWYKTGVVEADFAMRELFNDLVPEGRSPEEFNDIWEMAQHVTHNYIIEYESDIDDYKFLASEMSFCIVLDYDSELAYTGTVDLLLEDKEGKVWLFDHKTTSQLDAYVQKAEMDRQISRYMWVVKKLMEGDGYIWSEKWQRWVEAKKHPMFGKKLGGFLYNIIKKDYPLPPKELKSGKLSTAKTQKTTHYLFMETLKEMSEDQEQFNNFQIDYADYLAFLQEREAEGSQYFHRLEVVRNEEELYASIEEFYFTCLDMQDVRNSKQPRIYRNITSDCSWDCEFKELCKAGMSGGNESFLLASLYQEREMSEDERAKYAIANRK